MVTFERVFFQRSVFGFSGELNLGLLERFKAYGTELWLLMNASRRTVRSCWVLIRGLRFTVRICWLCYQIKAYGTGETTRTTILVHLPRTASPKCLELGLRFEVLGGFERFKACGTELWLLMNVLRLTVRSFWVLMRGFRLTVRTFAVSMCDVRLTVRCCLR